MRIFGRILAYVNPSKIEHMLCARYPNKYLKQERKRNYNSIPTYQKNMYKSSEKHLGTVHKLNAVFAKMEPISSSSQRVTSYICTDLFVIFLNTYFPT